MKINTIICVIALALSFNISSVFAQTDSIKIAQNNSKELQIQHIRNATARVTYGDTALLIDPMLAKKGAYPGFEGTYRSELRNPMVELPISVQAVINDIDAIIITHTHLDHWDDVAQQLLPKSIPLFTQNEADAAIIRSQGFMDVRIIDEQTKFNEITLSKTGGQHGTDTMYAIPFIANSLGEAMGVVLQADNYKTVYFAGDTIWRQEVQDALSHYTPDIVVLNTGYARMNDFEESIIMGKEDVYRTYNYAPNATIIAVHMDAVNHAELNREELKSFVQEKDIQDRVLIPNDGEIMKF